MAAPTLRQLRMFCEVVQSGSISAAARALNVTQPAASQQLHALERALGQRLLERAAGKVMATAAGDAVLGPARRAVAAADEAVAVSRVHRTGGAGRVRLGTGATACIHLLPPVLAALRRRMPGLELVVATGNSAAMLERLESGDLDAALVTLAGAVSRALAARRLFSDPVLALVPVGFAPGESALRPAEVSRFPLILYERGGSTRGIVDGWFQRAGLAPRPVMELGNVEAIKMLVGGGLGASLLPRMALGEAVPGTVVVPLRPRLAREIGIVLRRDKVRERGIRMLVDELERIARDWSGATDAASGAEAAHATVSRRFS